jgi:hypothetical protein
MSGIKPTKAELATRIETVIMLVLSGLRRSEILRYAAEKTDWNVKERTLDDYLARAYRKIEESAEKNTDRNMALAQNRLLDLYKRSLNIQDYKTCLSIIREIAKLGDLYPVEKHEHTGKDGGPIDRVTRIALDKLTTSELAVLHEILNKADAEKNQNEADEE